MGCHTLDISFPLGRLLALLTYKIVFRLTPDLATVDFMCRYLFAPFAPFSPVCQSFCRHALLSKKEREWVTGTAVGIDVGVMCCRCTCLETPPTLTCLCVNCDPVRTHAGARTICSVPKPATMPPLHSYATMRAAFNLRVSSRPCVVLSDFFATSGA